MNAPPGILLIAYHFPPSAAVGGFRMAHFANGLSSIGWEPHVLTIREKAIEQLDPERLRTVEGVRVHRTTVLPTLDGMSSAVLARWRRAVNSPPPSPGQPGAALPRDASRNEALSRRIKRYLNSFLVLPDRERGWILPATVAAISQIHKHQIGWMMTSCPPYSGHLIGLAVKSLTGTKWAADFRDPWMTTGSKRLYPTSTVSIRIESWLERHVIEKADLVVFNVERLRNAYRERYRHLPGEKFVFIPNAIPGRASSEGTRVSKYEAFTLTYTGSLYLGRSPEPVCQAVSLLIREGKAKPESIRIKLVGDCSDSDGVPTASLVRKYGLESVVEVRDLVSHAEALEIISRSHLALLFAAGLPFQIPAKAYDYLGAGTRILAIADDGATADLIRDTGCGRAFPPEDVGRIATFIYQEMTSLPPSNDGPAASVVRFDVRRITEELSRHLRRVAETSRASGGGKHSSTSSTGGGPHR